MSSADSTDDSHAEKAEKAEEVVTETTATESTTADEKADASADAADGVDDRRSDAAERRDERRARREERADASVSVSVRTIKIVAAVLVGVLVIAGFAICGWQLWAKNQRLDAFNDSKAAAGEFIETYFEASMAPNATAAELRKKVEPLVTGDLAKRLASDADGSIKFMKQNKIENGKVEISATFVESFDTDRATVVVGSSVSGSSAIAPGGGKQGMLLQLEMEKVDGTWRAQSISELPVLSIPTGQGGQQAPTEQAPTEQAPAPSPGG